jgi:CheY-like chemotaxis protein
VTLLIVDDNAESRRLMRTVCLSLTAEIREASDGESAIRACNEVQPDWVLMDLRMRPMNGLTATRNIHQRWPKVRVIIITNQDDEESHLAASEAGACAFLSKEQLVDLPKLLSKKLNEAVL